MYCTLLHDFFSRNTFPPPPDAEGFPEHWWNNAALFYIYIYIKFIIVFRVATLYS